MKTNVVEYGTVVETKGALAKVILDKGTSCRKCGMAALGLCKPGGSGLMVEVDNPLGAKIGDRVKLGLKKQVHRKGYILAFILPLLGFVISALTGYIFSRAMGGPALEVPVGLIGLGGSIYVGLRKLKKMDNQEKLHIEKILAGQVDMDPEAYYNSESMDYLQRFSS